MFMQNIQDAAIGNDHFCGYLQDFQSSIARHQLFDCMATIISGRFDRPSSSGVIFKRCSTTFKFSNHAPGDS